APGTAESVALAAWEVLTGARVARSTASGRMSLLGRYRAAGVELSTERVLWIALHPFEGADERWACRRARGAAMSDQELQAAVVQEMGGPAEDPDEMTTLGFWSGSVGFHFDCRGPSVEITDLRGAGAPAHSRKRRIGRSALLRAARKILSIDSSAGTERPTAHWQSYCPEPSAASTEQLSLL
ncbi:MAG TPA: hypothetical protein VLK84_17355, partial [Longimicrobium sp.]|nr:hypothetical protein [Longimicrobium sp.]